MARSRSDTPEKRQRILQAAEELFLEHGYIGTTLAMVSARSGSVIGSVTHLVGQKPELAREVHRRLTDDLASQIAAAAQGRAGEEYGISIRRVIDVVSKWLQANTARLTLLEALEIHPLDEGPREEQLASRLANLLEREPSVSRLPSGETAAGPRLYALLLAPVFAEARLLRCTVGPGDHFTSRVSAALAAAALAGLTFNKLPVPARRPAKKSQPPVAATGHLFSDRGD